MFHARIQIVLSEGVILNASNIFSSRKRDPNIIIGPPAKRRFPGGPMMALLGGWLGGFVILQRIQTSVAMKPYIL